MARVDLIAYDPIAGADLPQGNPTDVVTFIDGDIPPDWTVAPQFIAGSNTALIVVYDTALELTMNTPGNAAPAQQVAVPLRVPVSGIGQYGVGVGTGVQVFVRVAP